MIDGKYMPLLVNRYIFYDIAPTVYWLTEIYDFLKIRDKRLLVPIG